MLKRKGPRLLPWGTPNKVSREGEIPNFPGSILSNASEKSV